MKKLIGVVSLVAAAMTGCQGLKMKKDPLKPQKPIVIGHRGASGYKPEHTLASYQLAISQGADFIEPDLVMTKDRVLIARHENEISGTTNVAEKFPKRKTKKSIDGVVVEGYFTEDFTLSEIKELKAKQRLKTRSQDENNAYPVATFKEILDLVRQKSAELGRPIGIYPEIKHSSYFKSVGLPMEDAVLAMLSEYNLNSKDAPVYIQSFEVENLKQLHAVTPVKLIQLLGETQEQPFDFVLKKDPRTFADMMTAKGLAEIAQYATGIGPDKRSIVPEKNHVLQPPTDLILLAHKAGLQVHPYTFRTDKEYLHPYYKGDPLAEYRQFFQLGVDGLFSDFPDTAVKARDH